MIDRRGKRARPGPTHAVSMALAGCLGAIALASPWIARDWQWLSVAATAISVVFAASLGVLLRTLHRREVTRSALQAELMERARTGLAILDNSGRAIVHNAAFAEMARQGAGASLEAIWPSLHRPRRGADGGPLYQEVEVGCVAPSGQRWQARVTAYPMDGSDSGFHSCVVEDVTPVRDAEEALRSSDVELALLHVASTVLAEAESPEDAIPPLLQTVCEYTDWVVSSYWEVDQQEQVLRCRHLWQRPGTAFPAFTSLSRDLAVKPGQGLLGRAWETRRAGRLADVAEDGNIIRSLKAQHEGLRSSMCFPVTASGDVFGIIEVWSQEPAEPSPGFTRAMNTVAAHLGIQLSRFLALRTAEERREAGEQRYRSMTELAHEAILSVDAEGVIRSVNGAMERLVGYSQSELVGEPLTTVMPPELRQAHLDGFWRYRRSGGKHMRWEHQELPVLRKDGSTILVDLSIAEFHESGTSTFMGFMQDVTERKQEESALVYQALHDTLTDLPNRMLLQDRLERSIANGRRQGTTVALLFMDLDRFKEVNDTFGHHCGDMLLQQVSLRLQQTVRDSDTVARLGGDEFALLLPLTDEQGASQAARRITEALQEPFILARESVVIGASIGIALCPEHGLDAATLMRRADVAMYAAKRSGSDFTMYSAERDDASAMRLVMTNELRSAIERGQLFLHYQPIVSLKDGRAEHVEALIRWAHPERGSVGPDGFIPLAEETGLVKPLTLWVLDEVLREQQGWREEGLNVRVSVNFSVRMLHDPDLVGTVCSLLDERGVEPSNLQVEVTESALMADPDRALETLSRLREAGVWIAIDDFGTGYSSLSYLRRLPIDEIKIDKSFVIDMATNRDDASIVRSVVTLGHNLDLGVVAEGVENRRVLDMLSSMGCDLVQGFFLSRPMPAEELTPWLVDRNTTLANMA